MSRTVLPEVDYAATSARPAFSALPAEVRAACGDVVGAVVAAAAPPVGSGFTGAYAGVLTLEDGRRVFAKAGGPAMPHVVDALTAEARILPLLAGVRCASRLAGTGEVPTAEGTWRVLVLDVIEGRQPGDLWTTADADAAVAACLEVAALPPSLTATVTSVRLAPLLAGEEDVSTALDELASGTRAWPRELPAPSAHHRAELVALAARAGAALDGEALVHGDVRPDNLLLEADGTARLVDWNHATLGAPWVDLVGLWPLMAHHGIDVRRLAGVPPLAGVPGDDVDAFLAVLVGLMLSHVDAPPPPGCTPALRRHQLLMAGTTTALLAARRGW